MKVVLLLRPLLAGGGWVGGLWTKDKKSSSFVLAYSRRRGAFEKSLQISYSNRTFHTSLISGQHCHGLFRHTLRAYFL